MDHLTDDELIQHHLAARREGQRWQEVGSALGRLRLRGATTLAAAWRERHTARHGAPLGAGEDHDAG